MKRDLLSCKRCGEEEDELHIAFLCPFAQEVWELAPMMLKPAAGITNLQLLIKACSCCVNLPPIGFSSALSPWVLWFLWKARNVLIFENRCCSAVEIIVKLVLAAREWTEAQLSLTSSQVIDPIPIYPTDHHTPNTLLCFVDAAWALSSRHCGMGWCFKNVDNSSLSKHSCGRRFVRSALVAEALAMREALLSAKSARVTHLRVFSDSQSLITLIKNKEFVNEIRSIVLDIASLLSSFVSLSFSFISRSRNVDADVLAKEALAILNNNYSFMGD